MKTPTLLVLALCSLSAFAPIGSAAENAEPLVLSRPQWKLFLPQDANESGEVDLLVHFGGHPPLMKKNADQAGLNAAIVTVNYSGLSSVYRIPFEDPTLFQTLLDDALETIREQPGFGEKTRWGAICLSSFSAGYGAVREVIKHKGYFDRIDGVLAADSLYASTDTDGKPVDSQMKNYRRLAELAAKGEKTFIFTHTRVPTGTYENTAETGDDLLEHLGLESTPTEETGRGPLKFYRKARRGDFQFWGSPGETGEEHMEHLRHIAEWLGELPLAKIKIESVD